MLTIMCGQAYMPITHILLRLESRDRECRCSLTWYMVRPPYLNGSFTLIVFLSSSLPPDRSPVRKKVICFYLSERKHRSKAKLSRSSLKCMLERAVSGPVACLLYQLKRILPPTVDAHCLISQTALHLLVCRHPPYPTYLAVLATGLPPQDPAAHL